MKYLKKAAALLVSGKSCNNLQTSSLSMVYQGLEDLPIERNWKSNPRKYSNARVKYVPAETFINEFLEHLRLGEMKIVQEYLSKS